MVQKDRVTRLEKRPDGHLFCRGESMRPLFRPGDRIHFALCRVEDLRQGDVIIFILPGREERIVHRVVSTGPGGIRTRGDSNPGKDPWCLTGDQILGRVVAIERRSYKRHVTGGWPGFALAGVFRLLRRMDHVTSIVFHPIYRAMSRSGLFRAVVPAGLRPRVIAIHRDAGTETQLLMRNYMIGRLAPGATVWVIKRPFRLIVEEGSLPGVKETEVKNSRF
jgi:signal peptidase